MKRLHPDLFYSRWRVIINSQEYCAVGNIFLLDNPELCVVRFSRRYTESEHELHKQQWHRCLENGGVLVSPFIHPLERAMRNEASDAGGNMIEIRREGFPERYTPQGREFEEMTQGRLLIIGSPTYDTQTQPLTYAKAQTLNTLAEAIALGPSTVVRTQ